MSNYTQITNYAAKDALTTGDPNKKILGVQINAEFVAIQAAITSKEDPSNKNTNGGYVGIGAGGNVVLAAPASGATLFLTATAGARALTIQGSTTTGQSLGLNINAGTNASDQVLTIRNAANSAQYAAMTGDGNLTLNGNTSLLGSVSTYTGVTASTASGVAVTLQVLQSIAGATYLVFATIASSGDAGNYNEVALVTTNATTTTIATLQNAPLLSITVAAGLNVQATQSSGAPAPITYSILRIA